MAIGADSIWEFSSLLKKGQKQKDVNNYAEVTRVDEDGTVWVHVVGGAEETPINGMATSDVSPGDIVQVSIENNRANLLGNNTSPSVGVRKVEEVVSPVRNIAKDAQSKIGQATEASEAAKRAAAEAAEIAEAVDQHFWHDGNGAHITDATQDAWQEEYSKPDHGELDNPTEEHPWYNQLLGSAGTLLRTGLKNLAAWTRSAIAFYDGLGNSSENIVAMFGKDGAQLGSIDSTHANLDSLGFEIKHASGSTIAEIATLDSSTKIYSELTGTSWIEDDVFHLSGVLEAYGVVSIDDVKAWGWLVYSGGTSVRWEETYKQGGVQYSFDEETNTLEAWVDVSPGSAELKYCDGVEVSYYVTAANFPYLSIGARDRDAQIGLSSAFIGSTGRVSGDYSLGIGEHIQVGSPYSLIAGSDSSAHHDYSYLLGEGLTSCSNHSLTIGRFAGVPEDVGYPFRIGNGTKEYIDDTWHYHYSNCFDVDWDGNTTLSGGLYLRDENGAITGAYRRYSGQNYNGTEQYSTMRIAGTDVYNTLNLRVHSDGSRSVYVTDSAPWRTALDVDQKSYISDAGSGRAIQVQYSGTAQDPTNWYCMWQGYKIVAVPAKLEITTVTQVGAVASDVTVIDFRYVQSGKTAQLYIGFSFSANKSARDVVITLASGFRPATYVYGSSFTNFLPCEIHTDGRMRISAAAVANSNYYTSFTYVLA